MSRQGPGIEGQNTILLKLISDGLKERPRSKGREKRGNEQTKAQSEWGREALKGRLSRMRPSAPQLTGPAGRFPDSETSYSLQPMENQIPPNFLLSSVQSLSHVRLFATPWTSAHQASLSITNLPRFPELMSIKSVRPSNHLIPSSPSPPAFNLSQHQGLFQMSQFFKSGGQSIGASASASVLPMNIQD